MRAKLVCDKDRNGFRAIVEHEKSNSRFIPFGNTSQWVEVEEANDDMLRLCLVEVLEKFDLHKPIIKSTEKLAEKFYKELVTYPVKDLAGALAYNETMVGKKFYLITGVEI